MKKTIKKNLLFRADGNETVGFGHLYRSIGLAERLSKNFNVYIGITNPTEECKKLVTNVAQLVILPDLGSSNPKVSASLLIEAYLVPLNISGLILDGYEFDTEFQREIKSSTQVTIISIDDFQPFHYISDYVINHAEFVPEIGFSKESYTKLLLGSKYSLLRKEFLKLKLKSKFIKHIKSIFICFGGADNENYTLSSLIEVVKINSIVRINVIIGASFRYLEQLEKEAKADIRINIYRNINARDLSNLMFTSEMAIVPSSTICLEAFEAKMIVVTGMSANNQEFIYNGIINYNNVIGIGHFSSWDFKNIHDIINRLNSENLEYNFASEVYSQDLLLNEINNIFYD